MSDYEYVAESFEELKIMLQEQVLENNFNGEGKQDYKELGEHFDLAIAALEKQIPIKPRRGKHDIFCASCDNELLGYERVNTPYCEYCGQAIDWSVE